MIILNPKDMPTYFTDREKEIIQSDRKIFTKKRIRKILNHTKYFNEEFFIVNYNGEFGICLEYELAWLNEKNIDGVDSQRMKELNKQYLDRINQLEWKTVTFFLSQHQDNINNALTIHAFISEKDIFNWTSTYLNSLYDLIYKLKPEK